MKGYGSPRWLFKLHAKALKYFWLPCPLCGFEYSGWEWWRNGAPSMPTERVSVRRGICTDCYKAGQPPTPTQDG